MKTMYMHTLDGKPATFEPRPWPSLIIIQQPSHIYPAAGGVLVRSVRTIVAQQARCPKSQQGRVGYVRLWVPS